MKSIPYWIFEATDYAIGALVLGCLSWFVVSVVSVRRSKKVTTNGASDATRQNQSSEGYESADSLTKPSNGGLYLAGIFIIVFVVLVLKFWVQPETSSAASGGQDSSPTPGGLLSVVTRGGARNTIADVIQNTVKNSIEKPLEAHISEEAIKTQCEDGQKTLIRTLRDMERNGTKNSSGTLSVAAYGFLLCETSSKQWEKVRQTGKWAEDSNLPIEGYGFAVRVYGAEAFIQGVTVTDELFNNAIMKYKAINNQPGEAFNEFLSPIDFRRIEDPKAFVKERIDQLTQQRDRARAQKLLADAKIWIYDMTDGSLANSLAETLKDHDHLSKAVGKGRWKWRRPRFYEATIYYKDGQNAQNREVLKNLATVYVQGFDIPLDYASCPFNVVKDEFATNLDLDFLIFLPDSGPTKRSKK